MTLTELKTKLDASTLPVVYDHWPAEQDIQMPYVMYHEAYSNNVMADNKTYKVVRHVQIVLWTKEKDETVEAKLETALSDLSWQMTDETWEDDVQAYSRLYEVEI